LTLMEGVAAAFSAGSPALLAMAHNSFARPHKVT